MHFDPSPYTGTSLFWVILKVYWETFSPAVKVIVAGYLVVLLYILIRGDKKERIFFWGNILLLIVTCLNPWMARYLIDKWSFFARYFRLFWLIPVSMGYTYAGIRIYERVEDKGKLTKTVRCALGVLVAVLFIFSCQQVVGKTSFGDIYTGAVPNTGMIMVSNVYKVEDDLIEVCNIIETDSGDPERVKMALYNRDVCLEIRTYDPAIIPLIKYGAPPAFDFATVMENHDLWGVICMFFSGQTEGVDASQMTPELLKEAMSYTECEYIILPNDNTYYDIWTQCYSTIGDAGRYTVLRVR